MRLWWPWNMTPCFQKSQTPRDTEGYEGFFHLTKMEGNVEKAVLSYIIRDHMADSFEKREEIMKDIADQLNKKVRRGNCHGCHQRELPEHG